MVLVPLYVSPISISTTICLSSISISTAIYVSSISISPTIPLCMCPQYQYMYKCGTGRSSTPCIRTRRPHESERWHLVSVPLYMCPLLVFVAPAGARRPAYARAGRTNQRGGSAQQTSGTCMHALHTSAYVSIRQHTQGSERWQCAANVRYLYAFADYVSIRQHTKHTSARASIRQHTPAYVRIRSIGKHTQHTSA